MSTIIGKLPSSWKDYQKILKHKKKSLNLDQLLQHIQIESEARNRDAPDKTERNSVHTVEGNSMKKKFVKGKGPSNFKRKREDFKQNGNKKKKGPCFVCGKLAHLARVCYFRKSKKAGG